MRENKECNHLSVHSILCKYCGRLQCDLCRKDHELQHIRNNDDELQPEDFD